MTSAGSYFADLVGAEPIQAVRRLLESRRPDTWAHVCAVANVAEGLADRFGADQSQARLAALCHDLAAVVPKGEMIRVAEAWGVLLSEADRTIPQILHGPVAAAVMAGLLGIEDADVLNAVRYHTTLRAGASLLEKIVFLADKLAYDPTTPQTGYVGALQEALARGIDAAAYVYLDFVVTRQGELGWVLHPDLLAAHKEVRRALGLA